MFSSKSSNTQCWTVTGNSSKSNDLLGGPTYRIDSSSLTTVDDHPFALQILLSASGSTASVTASSTGSKLSNFMLLDVGPGRGFYVYNPVSSKLLAQGTQSPNSSDTTVVAEDCATFLASAHQSRFIWHLFLDEDVPITSKSLFQFRLACWFSLA